MYVDYYIQQAKWGMYRKWGTTPYCRCEIPWQKVVARGETRFVVTHLREPQQERNKGMVE